MNSTMKKSKPARGAGMTTYADGSAIVRRIRDQPGSDLAGAVWARAQVVACSAIAFPEARAALAQAHRDGRLDGHELHEAACVLERVVAEATVIPVDVELAATAGRLAEHHGLDAADALHLAAALSLDVPRVVVATWRPGLASAAADCGMAVVPREPAPVSA
jgi:predicted nucleic acid-binding protein